MLPKIMADGVARAEGLLLDARAALGMQQVERRLLGVRRHEQTHRNGHEPEADRARPDRSRRHPDQVSVLAGGKSMLGRAC